MSIDMNIYSNKDNQKGDKELPLISQKPTYMITPHRSAIAQMSRVQPMSAQTMSEIFSNMGLDVVRRIQRSQKTIQIMGAGAGGLTDVFVVQCEPERAVLLRQTIPQNLMISEDKILDYGYNIGTQRMMPRIKTLSATAEPIKRKFRFRILGQEDKPISKVTLHLTGDAFPAQGVTNGNGEVELEYITLENRPPRLLTATAIDSYWDVLLNNPQITQETVNIIRMRALADTIPGFPQGFQYGWGQRVFGLDQVPKEFTGSGVKIAIIDSGCDNKHPLLEHIQFGQDFTSQDSATWSHDPVGHGTHCAGIIAAHGKNGNMMRGFAPEAEIHILKIFPGGRYSSLLEALDYCIDNQIDVVNMSLGADSEINPAIEQTLELATQSGIMCVVAAGNSGDAVKYPACSPQALAVAAVGSFKDLQPNTWDSTTVQEKLIASDGIFVPSFTCFGPEIDVCAPGVSIISTVPGGAYESQSGTSMAAPHVTGFAALLLAHHPIFQYQFRERNIERVMTLVNMMRSLCTPYPFGSNFTGVGLPQLAPIISSLQTKPIANGIAYGSTYASDRMTGGTTPFLSERQMHQGLGGIPSQGFASGNLKVSSTTPYQMSTHHYTH